MQIIHKKNLYKDSVSVIAYISFKRFQKIFLSLNIFLTNIFIRKKCFYMTCYSIIFSKRSSVKEINFICIHMPEYSTYKEN